MNTQVASAMPLTMLSVLHGSPDHKLSKSTFHETLNKLLDPPIDNNQRFKIENDNSYEQSPLDELINVLMLEEDEVIHKDVLLLEELIHVLSSLPDSLNAVEEVSDESLTFSSLEKKEWPPEVKLAVLLAHALIAPKDHQPPDLRTAQDDITGNENEKFHEDTILNTSEVQRNTYQGQLVSVLNKVMEQSPELMSAFKEIKEPSSLGAALSELLKRLLVVTSQGTRMEDKSETNISKDQKNQRQFDETLKMAFTRHVDPIRVQSPSAMLRLDHLTQPMTLVVQQAIHLGEKNQTSEQFNRFLHQFETAIANRSFVQHGQGLQQLTIKLYPEHLGRLDVTLSRVNGVMAATIMASTSAARELIDSQVQHLRQAFASQHIAVDKIEITSQQGYKEKQDDREEHKDEPSVHEEQNEKAGGEFEHVLNAFINEKI
ncbi:flagellar hook-length control protein FliK [Alteribacter aurantiacus]|uniref:flagellar hook-length control protein FliK n=1 Tax=Alteribacter aurantiacus TaxID=254410 RepID=UPI0003FCC2F0|nr:flagellar hook-length control protein FliK [Alteribacter aurantiacus]